MIKGVIRKRLNKYNDERGWLSEVWREDELTGYKPVMAYISETKPGVARGPHEHEKQSDCFVFVGPGNFELHLWDKKGAHEILSVGQDNPTLIIVPPGVVHAYKCVSDVAGWVINLPDNLYAGEGKKDDVDEIRWEDNPESPYHII
ncbi:dTDP-4-dehydrorhamnose 3,5-epimerase [Candidatus Falkowbacteria bacterium CG10_big_fil_rev_8_21_14_0_10_43_10]|uniref:dTDP-4-dehydrorhamnose 3,5-epimerase n=1 Tax=Candidatus Falkowbacteria bacterium CG10_big_fil_rev_8_21_14_0_10_43_10 TaxID=1974567 RepID=A0A2H0V2I6_9BACT|nr:MAG: dTDP-4-dehydrorhamnose 3,5-epimerase [Candidatus Falkowbacteria bacterium CG10_big_fil_rev_8_21_14_0_10_43_10]